ncbi:odorant receptor 13a-like isoform X1 [Cotesia glomerata]|uniref:odorant receptor 13a-like isoform X1 n=1 Tax=Cotesia glomerata TaxID=32391 RepID=UPI001D03194B|nr:odorant receptor 13a-like isoform X1 [Cotesia glomerata]
MKKSPIITHRATLDYTLYLAKLLGLFEIDEEPLSKYVVVTLFRIFNWIIVTLITVANAADFCMNIDDFQKVSYSLNYMFPFLMTEFKSMAIYLQRDKFRRLINNIHAPILMLKYSSDLGVLTTIRSAITLQNFDYSMFVGATIAIVGLGALPMKTFLRTREFPVRGSFPFDATQFPIFEIILISQCYVLLVACTWINIFDTPLLGFIRWINVQLIILQANYRHCDDLTTSRANFSVSQQNYNIIQAYQFLKVPEEQKEIRSFVPFTLEEANVPVDSFLLRFRTCVIHHRRLINNLNNCNSFFGFVLFGQILSSVLLFCVGLFTLAVSLHNNRVTFADVVILGYAMAHLFYYCIYGNQLIIENDKLLISIYECGWENHLSRKSMRLILNGLTQGLTPMKMTAGAFFVFSMQTYLSVIKTSYSYFAILINMVSDDE